MKKKTFHKLIEENMKNILKDKEQLEEIYRRIDENILLKTKKSRIN
ncbi:MULTISPECIES: FbpB family small basic protein [unclassified Cytobacillus]|nr:FbpB family small basic protein [Cytobacillus sp. AMY 15.2]MCM3094175.1 FbpB family small basic protein [Cytobacillus sp. AMY 15.2]